MFNSVDGDKGLVLKLIREANIILASLDKNSDEYKNTRVKYEGCISVARAIEKTDPIYDNDINFIINTITKIWNIGVLSPLTLTNDEFENNNTNGYYMHKRYPHIYHCDNGKIYNRAAYKLFVKAAYDANFNTQVKFKEVCLSVYDCISVPIFISKGGIITGEYIQQCEIRKDIIDKHCFTIQSIVNIPVSKIIDNNTYIYVVDHREPKLKILKEFYEVSVYVDENIKNKHYNIRKYTKLKK